MSDKEIIEYLKVEWVDDESHKRLVEALGLKTESNELGKAFSQST